MLVTLVAARHNCFQEPFKTIQAVRISLPRKIWVGGYNTFPQKWTMFHKHIYQICACETEVNDIIGLWVNFLVGCCPKM